MSKVFLFTSPTCGPCKNLKRDLESLGLKDEVDEVDVTLPENISIMSVYGIRTVPTLVFIASDGGVIRTRSGYTGNTKDLQELFL